MVYFEQRVVLPADTQSRIDTFLSQVDAFLALLNTSSTAFDKAVSPVTIKEVEGTLKNISATIDKTITPAAISTFLDSFKSMAATFDRAITETTPAHVENALKRIESIFANVDAIAENIRNFTNVVSLLVGVLCVSLVVNLALLICVRRRGRIIATLKDRGKKAH